MRRVKVLFDHDVPFLLAHGGFQTQIQNMMWSVRAVGIESEPLRWWDESQKADIIHFFGRPSSGYFDFVRQKGFKFVFFPLLTGVSARAPWKLALQRIAFGTARNVAPFLKWRLGWDAFLGADACVTSTKWEAHLMSYIFGSSPERVHVVPNGIEDVFLKNPGIERGPWLVCTATITERKRVLEIAQAAVQVQRPVWFIGKPYGQNDPYAQQFIKFAQANPKFVRFEGPIQDRKKLAEAYWQARGFVLLSTMETLSLSSAEAAAAECPLLLTDQEWAHEAYGDTATYCPLVSVEKTGEALRKFYDAAPSLPKPRKPMPWVQIGEMFKSIYTQITKR